MFLKKIYLVICLTAGISGCSSFDISSDKTNSATPIKIHENAMLAIKHCGKGNVKAVDSSKFTCKK